MSSFLNSTVSPGWTVSSAGWKRMPFMMTWPFADDSVAEGFCDAVPEDWRMRANLAPRKLAAPKRGCATEMHDPLRSTRTAIPCRTRHAVKKGVMRFTLNRPAMTATAWRGPDGPEAGALRLAMPTSTRRSARWGSAHFRLRQAPAGDMPPHG